MSFEFRTTGFCPICQDETEFHATDPWFRDNLTCLKCPKGSMPRERALMQVIERLFPGWRELSIHESSPAERGASLKLGRECKQYTATQFFPDREIGVVVDGFRNENLEHLTFGEEQFDLIITQDVLEHVNFPDLVFRECARTLKNGGAHVFTVPTVPDMLGIRRRAQYHNDRVEHFVEPIYHASPIDPRGSLVTFDYGYRLPNYIREWSGLDTEVIRFHDAYHGLLGDYMEVYVSWKH